MTDVTGASGWSETDHQVAFFKWVDEQIKSGKTYYVTLGAIPNGHGQIGGVTLRGYKSLGFRVGMPDIFWFVPRGKYHGLFIELKTLKKESKPSPDQVLFRQVLEKHGYKVDICHGYKSAIKSAERYDGLQRYIEE